MRLLSYFNKTFWENLREWKILVMALAFGPFFIYLMYFYFGTTSPTYSLLVIHHDQATAATESASKGLIDEWKKLAYPDGKPVFMVHELNDLESAKKRVRSRDADLLIEIPADFSKNLTDYIKTKNGDPPTLINTGDSANMRYMTAMAFADFISFSYVSVLVGTELPLNVDVRNLQGSRSLSEFDLYVPALLVLAVIMVLFTAAASVIKEVDKGTIQRLILSKLSTFEFLAAISLNQVLITTLALGLTFLSALHVGYQPTGSVPLFLFVGALAGLSVIAISLIVAASLKTIFELLTVGVFPFFLLMFFSESMIPLPRLTLLQVLGHTYYVNDILPTSLAVRAFNKILNFNTGIGDLGFELAGIVLLTIVYFIVGVWFFRRRHMRIY